MALAAPTYVAQHHGTVTSQAATIRTSAPGLLPRALHMANLSHRASGHAQSIDINPVSGGRLIDNDRWRNVPAASAHSVTNNTSQRALCR
jgi:hypothetical protein